MRDRAGRVRWLEGAAIVEAVTSLVINDFGETLERLCR